MIVGMVSYVIFNYNYPRPLGMHAIVASLVLSLIAFVVVSKFTKEPAREIIETFWGV